MIYLLCDHSEEPFAVYVSKAGRIPSVVFDPVKRGLLLVESTRSLGTSNTPGVDAVQVTGTYRTLTLEESVERRRVYQRTLDPKKGDCTRSCVATVTGLAYEDVPDLDPNEPEKFWDVFMDFFEALGFSTAYYGLDGGSNHIPNGIVLVSGQSPRNAEINHMVVYRDKKLWHDPHPSQEGIVKPKGFWKFVPNDIGIARKCSDLNILRHPTL